MHASWHTSTIRASGDFPQPRARHARSPMLKGQRCPILPVQMQPHP